MNAVVYRHNRFELRAVTHNANDFEVVCSERGMHNTPPAKVELHESLFTEAELRQIHAVADLLERKTEEELAANMKTMAERAGAVAKELAALEAKLLVARVAAEETEATQEKSAAKGDDDAR